jgi:hypothetical protein
MSGTASSAAADNRPDYPSERTVITLKQKPLIQKNIPLAIYAAHGMVLCIARQGLKSLKS